MPLSLSLSQKSYQTNLETPSPPPTTTSGHHEPLLLAAGPPQGEEHFNQSGTLRIHLKDSIEKQALNHFFQSFFEIILTSMPFS